MPIRGGMHQRVSVARHGQVGSGLALALVVVAGVCVFGALWWRGRVRSAPGNEVAEEAWSQVQDLYPITKDRTDESALSAETMKAIVQANPFSPERRVKPPAEQSEAERNAGTSATVLGPRFAFKGQINLGTRRRAILEDLVAHKTVFLEVGQEVAGFKLLDIQERQVVLSDPQTHEAVAVTLTSTALPSAHPADRGPGRQAGSP